MIRFILALSALSLTACASTTPVAAPTVTDRQTVTETVQPTITETVTYTPPPPPGPKTTIESDGTYVVGTDIVAGVYRTSGSSGCYWARLRTLSTNDIIDNNNSDGPQSVEIMASDTAFQTKDCATWQIVQ